MDSFLKYFGGKSLLRDEIIQMIPPHKSYVEAFCGASWVLFSKPPSHFEVINDIDNNLVNLYLVIKNQLDRFLDWLELIPISETLFNSFGAAYGIPCGDLKHKEGYLKGIPSLEEGHTENAGTLGIPEAAAKLYYVLMNSFNGKLTYTPSFSFDLNHRSRFVKFYNTDWEKVRMRLKEVTILNRDFREIIKKYDSPETFFYFDPPYMCATDNKKYYKHTFTMKDHQRFKVYLEDLNGKFILSYGENSEIREMYKDFQIKNSSNYPGELLISNFEQPDKPFYCSYGIPNGARAIPRANWDFPNCPYCGSRETQQVSKRVTLLEGRRSWLPCGFMCRNCKELYKKT